VHFDHAMTAMPTYDAIVIESGGTITHHHAVGRDHIPWYQRQRPALFGAALAAAKPTLDPAGILNPGVLVPVGSR
jgi:alkyldihydroxyacetonephosphate synthase